MPSVSETAGIAAQIESLPIVVAPAFARLTSNRLRYLGEHGTPDEVDRLSAAVVCSSLVTRPATATMVVFPDDLDRRAPLLFATALVMDAVSDIETHMSGQSVLYVSTWAGVRAQLSSIRVKNLSLGVVFGQQYGRGGVDDLQTTSSSAAINLPSVLCVYAPADPRELLRTRKPTWVAIDCANSRGIPWLRPLLEEARLLGIPVIGWSAQPLSDSSTDWIECGGGLLRWPRIKLGSTTQIDDIAILDSLQVRAEVTPRVLAGARAVELARTFARASEALISARSVARGRLAEDAVLVGWRLLRALEGMTVPFDVFEREARAYWGSRPISNLQSAFERFLVAVQPHSATLHTHLGVAFAALTDAIDELKKGDPPLWQGLANLCVESTTRRQVVFTSRARREMFALTLLARFNVAETDLRELGVELAHLSGPRLEREAGGPRIPTSQGPRPVLVGLPSRHAERYLEPLLSGGFLEVLIWPHQQVVLNRRLASIGETLAVRADNVPGVLDPVPTPSSGSGQNRVPSLPSFQVKSARELAASDRNTVGENDLRTATLWTQPNSAEAISALFAMDEGSNEDDLLEMGVGYAATAAGNAGDTEMWVAEAIEIRLDDGRRLILPFDETVNIVVPSATGVSIDERYVRAVRPGDELLLIQGQRRQSLYQLLVSRVHRDPVIGQYLALVRRWQDDFILAFSKQEALAKMNPEVLLAEIRKRGSDLTSPQTIRTWLKRLVQAPIDVEDLRRVAEVLSLPFVATYYRQIHKAARRLSGLHISLSARLNRWLTSSDHGSHLANDEAVIDAELDLRVEDFRDSLLRRRVQTVTTVAGPFYRPHLGNVEN